MATSSLQVIKDDIISKTDKKLMDDAKQRVREFFGSGNKKQLENQGLNGSYQNFYTSTKRDDNVLIGLVLLESENSTEKLSMYRTKGNQDIQLVIGRVVKEILNKAPDLAERLKKIQSTLSESRTGEEILLCGYCQEDPAAVWCEDCTNDETGEKGMYYCKIDDPVLHANPTKRSHKRTNVTPTAPAKEIQAKDEEHDVAPPPPIEDDEEKEFGDRLLAYKNRKRAKKCRIMVIGLSQHGKSTTLNTIFGEECFPAGMNGESTTVTVKERQHPRDDSLVFIDTPGLSDTTRNDREILNGIMKHAKGKPLDAILVCRRFTHPNTHDYAILKDLTQKVSKQWKKTPIIMVYTRSQDKPDAGIVQNLADVKKYAAPPYSYKKRGQKFAAFRNFRIAQAKKDGYHACFFFENQGADEDWQLPDGSSCLDPFVNFLAHLSPDVVPNMLDKNIVGAYNERTGFFGHIMLMVSGIYNLFSPQNWKKSAKGANVIPRAINGMCHACTFINGESAVDCSLCKAPLELTWKEGGDDD